MSKFLKYILLILISVQPIQATNQPDNARFWYQATLGAFALGVAGFTWYNIKENKRISRIVHGDDTEHTFVSGRRVTGINKMSTIAKFGALYSALAVFGIARVKAQSEKARAGWLCGLTIAGWYVIGKSLKWHNKGLKDIKKEEWRSFLSNAIINNNQEDINHFIKHINRNNVDDTLRSGGSGQEVTLLDIALRYQPNNEDLYSRLIKNGASPNRLSYETVSQLAASNPTLHRTLLPNFGRDFYTRMLRDATTRKNYPSMLLYLQHGANYENVYPHFAADRDAQKLLLKARTERNMLMLEKRVSKKGGVFAFSLPGSELDRNGRPVYENGQRKKCQQPVFPSGAGGIRTKVAEYL